MNWSVIEGKWQQVKGELKSRWAKLTDDDLQAISAKREQLVGKLQERYGVMRDDAERQIDDWLAELDRRKPSQRDRHS